jgi:long-subunit acyl-CoA synthetase (AMP-forming)
MKTDHQISTIKLGEFEPSIGLMLRERKDRFGPRVACQERSSLYGEKPYFSQTTWEKLYAEIASVGSSLIASSTKKGDKLAVLSRNRKEMLIFELACMSIGAVSVPIFSEYPSAQVDYILSHSGAKILVVCDLDHLHTVLKTQASKHLETVFLMENTLHSCSLDLRPFSSLLETNAEVRAAGFPEFHSRIQEILPDDPCVMMYTSGTTGKPKGVILSHGNILSQQKALDQLWQLGPSDRFLSYLPWHHSFGGLFERFRALYCGATFTLDDSYGKDLPRLIENFKAVKPTVYFSAPRVYQALVSEAKHDPEVEAQLIHQDLKFIFTAAAPLPADVAQYFKERSIPVVEGWGLTETSPCCTLTSLDVERSNGVVGVPMPGIEVRISPSHEILVKGPNIMLGYHNDEDRTSKMIDTEGWLHTGDLGEITPSGLMLKGRKDGVFKLSNGEKVSSHLIETGLVNGSDYIDTAIAVGRGQNHVTALIFPNFKNVCSWAKNQGIADTEIKSLLRSNQVRELLVDEIEKMNLRLNEKYARIRAAAVIDRPLSLERTELTPSLKVVRVKVQEHFAPTIQWLYDLLKSGLHKAMSLDGRYLIREHLLLPSDFSQPMEISTDLNPSPQKKYEPSEILYERNINSVVERLDENSIRAEASLVDLNHGMRVCLTIDLRTDLILSATARILKAPFEICTRTTSQVKRLEGLRLTRGINRKLLETLGGSQGCTHLYELALNAVRLAYNVKMGMEFDWNEWVSRTVSEEDFIEAARPHLKNSCLPFSELADGPLK